MTNWYMESIDADCAAVHLSKTVYVPAELVDAPHLQVVRFAVAAVKDQCSPCASVAGTAIYSDPEVQHTFLQLVSAVMNTIQPRPGLEWRFGPGTFPDDDRADEIMLRLLRICANSGQLVEGSPNTLVVRPKTTVRKAHPKQRKRRASRR